jgi:hypothetical protein
MVWGGISYDGSTDLYVIRNGSLTGTPGDLKTAITVACS